MRRAALLALALAVLRSPEGAAADDLGLEGRDEYSEPEMLSELKRADLGNLDNALFKSRQLAQEVAENLRVIMSAAGSTLRSVEEELSRSAGEAPDDRLRKELEELRSSAESLEPEVGRFLRLLPAAGLKAPPERADALARWTSYRRKERQDDLKRSEAYLAAAKARYAKDGGRLSEDDRALLEALRVWRRLLQQANQQSLALWRRVRQASPGPAAELAKTLLPRLQEQAKDFQTEERFIAVALELKRCDDAAFEAGE